MRKITDRLAGLRLDHAPMALLVAGITLRLSGLLTSSIWYDEAFSLELSRLPLLDMVRLASTDFNPPLWEMLIWPVVRLIGYNALGLRLLALLAGIAALFLTYRLTTTWTTGQRVYTMALAALLPGLLWISQDGRVYAVYSLLYLAGFAYASRGRWLGLLAICGLLLYAHGTGAFYVFALLLVAVAVQPQAWRRVAMVGGLALVAWLPWLTSTLSAASSDFWLVFDWRYVGVQSVGALFGPTLSGAWGLLAAIILALTLLSCVMIWLERAEDAKSIIHSDPGLLIAVVVPVLAMIVVSAVIKPVFFYRPLGPALLPFCLLVGYSITPRRLTWTSWVIPYSWAMLMLVGLAAWTPTQRGGDIESAANLIASGYKSGEVVYHATGTTYLPFREYLGEIPQLISDIPQPPALLRRGLGEAFGAVYGDISDNSPAWIVFAKDPVLSSAGQERFFELTSGARLMAVVHGWQFAPIEIWYREGKNES